MLAVNNLCMQGITSSILSAASLPSSVISSRKGATTGCYDGGSCYSAVQSKLIPLHLEYPAATGTGNKVQKRIPKYSSSRSKQATVSEVAQAPTCSEKTAKSFTDVHRPTRPTRLEQQHALDILHMTARTLLMNAKTDMGQTQNLGCRSGWLG